MHYGKGRRKRRMSREIYHYVDCNGHRPVDQFIETLAPKQQENIHSLLLQLHDHPLQPPHVKAIRNGRYKGLYELRSRVKQMVRIVFSLTEEGSIILLHGFIKSDNRSINRAMEMARIRQFVLSNGGAQIQKVPLTN